MAAENKPKTSGNSNRNSAGGKGNKRKYLAYGKPARKGAYPLRPGIEGFFLTCDGGRERQATNEALNLLDSFYEELVQGGNSNGKHKIIPDKPLNKKVIFKDSDSSSGEDEDAHEEPDAKASADDNEEVRKQQDAHPSDEKNQEVTQHNEESEDLPSKKQRTEEQIAQIENAETSKADEKHIDELIEDELKEIGDRNKRRFVSVDSGCNGVAFIRMNKKIGDPGPAEIVQHLMTSAASTRKHMSRFILRLLPAELTCYASEEEILKAIDPLIGQYFPSETATPQKFAVLYEARANTGVDRMKIINAVAKSVPEPHKVDLNNPDKTIIVEIAKTVCSIGVVERYKELSKYNLRQLTSPQK